MASSRIIAQILLLSSSVQLGIAFSIIGVQNEFTKFRCNKETSLLKASSSDKNSDNPKNVERVSVCLGELCKCQEESSEFILQDLQSRNLPYVVEDAPCLGACGMGAMVSIDYKDGGFDLVCGMEETHAAVGIIQVDGPCQSVEINDAEEKQEVDLMNDLQQIMKEAEPTKIYEELSDEDSGNVIQIESNTLQIGSDVLKEEEKPTTTDEALVKNEVDHGAVQRMREEAKTATEEQTNPWLNMALYLAEKAKESIMK